MLRYIIRYIIIFILLFCASFFAISCSQDKRSSNRLYFKIDSIDRKIVIPVQINDSITANLGFDTGAPLGTLDLDSTFCSQHPGIKKDNLITTGKSGSAWITAGYNINVYNNINKVEIGNKEQKYDYINTYNFKKYYNNLKVDGIFNISKYDSINIWELNFEKNYLELHDANNFILPKNCITFPLITGDYPFNVTLPIDILFSDNKSVNLHKVFMIDTGMPEDIAILSNAPELDFFNKRNDAVWTEYSMDYNRYYNVNAAISPNVKMDSLRIYTFDMPNSIICNYLIGQNFLKRFNVFFNLKNKTISLQPISNFNRVVNPGHRRFHYSVYQTPQGKTIVKCVADYSANYYKTAGLKMGDEIININGRPYNDYTWEEKKEFYKLDTIIMDVKRNGVPLRIEVEVNKEEIQGN